MAEDSTYLRSLARKAQAGDRGSARAFLVELYALVRKECDFILGSSALAEDAAQEAILAIHRALPSYRGDASPRTWALVIAARTARRLRRKDTRSDYTEDLEVATYDVDSENAAQLVLLKKSLAKLSRKKRDAFVLMAIFELNAKEAGRALGIMANTAASRYRHARSELRIVLADEAPSLTAAVTRIKTVGGHR